MLGRTILTGLVAGAAGTTALNAATYLDMALRGRPASNAPSRLVGVTIHRTGHSVPGQASQQQNRLEGMGPLAGIATGVGVGAVQAVAHRYGPRIPFLAAAAGAGLAAMLASNIPLAVTGVSDVRKWGVAGWLSDAAPHFAYGLTTSAIIGRTLTHH